MVRGIFMLSKPYYLPSGLVVALLITSSFSLTAFNAVSTSDFMFAVEASSSLCVDLLIALASFDRT